MIPPDFVASMKPKIAATIPKIIARIDRTSPTVAILFREDFLPFILDKIAAIIITAQG